MKPLKANDMPGKANPFMDKSSPLQILILVLMVAGFYGVLSGIIDLISGFTEGFAADLVKDVAFDLFFGPLVLAISLVLIKGKLLGLWLLIGTILLTMAFNFLQGREFNLLMTLIGAAIVWMLFKRQKAGELR
ncbi:hypothetical protein LARV_01036 [Longilinea arvoryzae]|uniref:Uncharacterized protein n=1 Tax=Longilinea arvoryzae TaxID=360412 RepID=A0A0S7BFD7_9CHLR|nr:hypothetical protein [Longilinea arvoryzae]GAP13283.1 hypothetical protein LARV_01036 [Longilinea arvoryzae]